MVKRVPRAERRTRAQEALDHGPARGGTATGGRASSPAASASGSRWPGRSSTGPGCCCSTSRSARSTSSCASRCRSSSRAPARRRHHLPVRDPRPGGGADDERPDRRLQRGPHRAGRDRPRGLRAAGHGVRRRLRRHLQPAPGGAAVAAARRAGPFSVRPEKITLAPRPALARPDAARSSPPASCARSSTSARRPSCIVDLDAGGRSIGLRQNQQTRRDGDVNGRGDRVRVSWLRGHLPCHRRVTRHPVADEAAKPPSTVCEEHVMRP